MEFVKIFQDFQVSNFLKFYLKKTRKSRHFWQTLRTEDVLQNLFWINCQLFVQLSTQIQTQLFVQEVLPDIWPESKWVIWRQYQVVLLRHSPPAGMWSLKPGYRIIASFAPARYRTIAYFAKQADETFSSSLHIKFDQKI